jgi:diguanylate cyclase (GGDEF)-like protein
MSTSTPSRSASNAHNPWRVILVGRTGLDQTLRRDANIELIRTRDSIEAIGELGDPIDHESPAQSIVIVSTDAIEDEPMQRKRFINALRLVDPGVCVMIVNDKDDAFDGNLRKDQSLDSLIASIHDAIEHADGSAPVALRFIDPNDLIDPVDAITEIAQPEQVEIAEPNPAPATEPTPEVTVVVKNDTFEHRAQKSFEDEDELHKQVVMGVEPARIGGADTLGHLPRHTPQVHDDEPIVRAMLKGKPILKPAILQINTRLGRSDITLLEPNAPGAGLGVPVVVGDKAVGVLCCDDERWLNTNGRALLATHASWLSTWIRLELQQSELRKCAFTDPLTGAWNRRYFERYLAAAIDQARAVRQAVTVMVFDIDSFKHYNDAYGHGAGDEILTETVKLLKSVIRPSDRVCRVGGDEFAVIFYEPQGPREEGSKPLESIYQIACRFQHQICNHRFPKLGAEALGTLTVSGGLASFPWDGHDASSLLESADRCAMESKRQGKNAITLGVGAETVCKLDR